MDLRPYLKYIARSPVSEGKIILSDDGDKVVYHDKLNPAKGKNFEIFDTLEFLAALSTHIPARNRKVVIYYGWYSQPSRGKRKREGRLTGSHIVHKQVENDNKQIRYRWSQLIKMVYRDPLICPACGGRMRIISFIQDKTLIECILKPLGLLDELHIHSPPSPKPCEDLISYELFFDDLPEDEQVELIQQAMN